MQFSTRQGLNYSFWEKSSIHTTSKPTILRGGLGLEIDYRLGRKNLKCRIREPEFVNQLQWRSCLNASTLTDYQVAMHMPARQ